MTPPPAASPANIGLEPKRSTNRFTTYVRDNPEWTIVLFFGAFWIAAIVICSFYEFRKWPLTVGVAFGASAVGALLGFLFGLPRSSARINGNASDKPSVQEHATNLEQVADWLTKIVIGAGLVELQRLFESYGTLCVKIADEYGLTPPASAFVGVWLAFFAVVGFLAAYNLTRVYLSPVYRDLEDIVQRRLAPIAEERDLLEERTSELESENLRAMNRSARFTSTEEADQGKRDPVLIKDPDDPHKGNFGGRNSRGGYELSAKFLPLNRPTSKTCKIELTVRRVEDGDPPKGNVEFYLHPSFDSPVVGVPFDGHIAVLRITTWGGFTVGVVTPDKTRLELDLAEQADAPWFVKEL